MEGDQQLEAVATHPKQKTIYGSPSLAEMYLTGVVDDIGQRDIFTVPGALDHGLPCGQSLLSRLQILLSLCKSCRTLSSLEILLLSGPSSAIHACSPKPLFLSGHKPVLCSAANYFFWQNPVSAYFQPKPIAYRSLYSFSSILCHHV